MKTNYPPHAARLQVSSFAHSDVVTRVQGLFGLFALFGAVYASIGTLEKPPHISGTEIFNRSGSSAGDNCSSCIPKKGRRLQI